MVAENLKVLKELITILPAAAYAGGTEVAIAHRLGVKPNSVKIVKKDIADGVAFAGTLVIDPLKTNASIVTLLLSGDHFNGGGAGRRPFVVEVAYYHTAEAKCGTTTITPPGVYPGDYAYSDGQSNYISDSVSSLFA